MFFFSSKYTVSGSGLLNGFTDWHSHILPGVDDGARAIDESLRILGRLENEGVARVCLTPHVMEDIPNPTSHLRRCFEHLKACYTGPVQLDLASEHMLDRLFEQRLQADDLLPLTAHGKQILVETSYFNPPMALPNILLRIKGKGYQPVLAHPERYRYMDAEQYQALKALGVGFQLNLPSLTGAYGKEARQKARRLLGQGWYDLCGLDIHSEAFLENFLASRLTRKEITTIQTIINKG